MYPKQRQPQICTYSIKILQVFQTRHKSGKAYHNPKSESQKQYNFYLKKGSYDTANIWGWRSSIEYATERELKGKCKKELRRTKVNRQIRRSIETNSDHIDLTMSANDLTR